MLVTVAVGAKQCHVERCFCGHCPLGGSSHSHCISRAVWKDGERTRDGEGVPLSRRGSRGVQSGRWRLLLQRLARGAALRCVRRYEGKADVRVAGGVRRLRGSRVKTDRYV